MVKNLILLTVNLLYAPDLSFGSELLPENRTVTEATI